MRENRVERQDAKILDDERLLRPSSAENTIEINIIGDDHLEHQGRAVHIDPAVLALNGLLLCRGEGYVPAQIIRDRIGYDASNSTFQEDMGVIDAALTGLTSIPELLSRPGTTRSKKYLLSDILDFVDRREDAATDPALRQFCFDLVGDLPKMADYDGQRVEFESRDARRKAFATMLKELADDPMVLWYGGQLTSKGWPGRLSSEAIATNFSHIEQALALFMQPDYDSSMRSDLMEGVMAYQELLFSTAPKVQILSSRLVKANVLRTDELFQEAMCAIMEDIMVFDQSNLEHGTLDQYFYTHMAMVASGYMRRQLDIERWGIRGIGPRQRELMRVISRESPLLEQELGREPSPAEIAERVKVDAEVVEDVLRMMSGTPFLLDFNDEDEREVYKAEYGALRQADRLDEIDETINRIDRQRQIDAIFGSDKIETRGKIALSIYYGIYIPDLGGKAFTKNRIDRGDWFVYPRDEADFLMITRKHEGSMTHMASLLKFDKGTLNGLVRKTLADAREVLRAHSRTATTW